ncbi:MAG: hypothetical protein ACKVOR_00655 [Flavobacteriales bacterium]
MMKTFTRISALLALCCTLGFSTLHAQQTCLTLDMFDAFGDGWNNGEFQLYSFADNSLVGTLTLAAGDVGSGEICVDDGCYYIEMLPGDWPGEITWTLTGSDEGSIDGDANSSGVVVSVNSDCILGCTDIAASNFNPAATIDDGSCQFCAGGEQVIAINMFDSFGDGWNGATFFIIDDLGNIAMTGTLATGTEGSVVDCLDAGCYTFSVTGGTFPGEVSWTLTDGIGNIIFAGGANEEYGFSWAGQTGCVIPGCMDDTCNNYNPFATEDDGSCVCPPANDDCADAIALGCGQSVDGTTISANLDAVVADCGGIPITEPGVWYTFIGTGQQVTLSTCNSGGADTRITVFSGTCAGLVCVAANDDACGLSSQLTFSTINGFAYYVMLHEWSFAPNSGAGVAFTLEMTCIDCDDVPINDDCAFALPQPDNIPTPGNLCCSSPDDISDCMAFQTGYGVWFTMNSSDYDTFDFTLLNGDMQGPDDGDGTNVGMVVYQDLGGGCGDLDAIACCFPVTDICAGSLSGIGLDIVPNTDYYFLVYTTDAEGCGNFSLNTNLAYLGCTDPGADNFDPTAEIEDGSCIYTQPPVNDLCDDAILLDCNSGVIGTTGLSTATNAPVGCALADDEGVWYTFVGDGQLITLSMCGSAIDSRISVVSSTDGCNGPFTCVVEEDNDFSAEGCPFPDTNDPNVTFITEIGTTYFVYVSAGQLDTDGDFIADLFDGPFLLDFTCEPVVEGCTNECACNYDPAANVEDNSCEYFSCVVCDPGSSAVLMDMTDAFGDGWNGATYTITDLAGNVIATGSIDAAACTTLGGIGGGVSAGFDVFCLEDGCYIMNTGGGVFDGEVGFSLEDENGNVIVSGGAGTFNFTVGAGLCGCTDPVACNYEPLATDDDNTCEYLTCAGCTDVLACNFNEDATITDNTECCYENCVTFIMNDAFGDGWNGAVATFTNAATGEIITTATLPNGTNATASICLEDGCFNLNVSNGTFPGEVSWTLAGINGGIVNGAPNGPDGVNFSVGSGNCTVGCTEPMACNYDPEAGFSDCTICEYTSCQGCTYPAASNYDMDALIDDGSCIIDAVSTCPADLDGDGVIGVSDLVIFIGAYGSVCPN